MPSEVKVVFVPGMTDSEADEHFEQLAKGLADRSSHLGYGLHSSEGAGGAKRFELTDPTSNRHVEFTLTDIQWSDLRPYLTTEVWFRKLLRGLSLLLYWVPSGRVWSRAVKGKYMLIGSLVTVLALLGWFYGALATALVALGSEESFLSGTEVAKVLGHVGDSMGGWPVWAWVGLFITVVPANQAVDVAYASMAFLKNQNQFASKASGRVLKVLRRSAGKPSQAQRVLLVSHSFGVTVALRALSDLAANGNRPEAVSFISLGSSLRLVMARSRDVAERFTKVLSAPWLVRWLDFWSDEDWLGTPTPDGDSSGKLQGRELQASAPLDQRIKGKTHGLYFEDPHVLDAVLEEVLALGQERQG